MFLHCGGLFMGKKTFFYPYKAYGVKIIVYFIFANYVIKIEISQIVWV